MANNETFESESTEQAMNSNDEGIYKKPEIESFEEFGHVALIGPTNSGKTTKMKTFLCDQNFKDYSMFVYVGQEKDLKEMAACWSAEEYLDTDAFGNRKMQFFELSKIESAIVYCQNKENTFSKLLFIDDALLQGSKAIKNIANFISQAKNYNTTVVVTMHSSTGDNTLKNIRTACRYWVFMNALPQEIAHLVKIERNDKLLLHYSNLSKFERVIIYDKETNMFFNKNYKSFQI